MAQATSRSRYRRLRELCNRHLNAAAEMVSDATLLDHARRIGMVSHGEIAAESDAEFSLLLDLALFTARPGRTRGIERYARIHAPADPDDLMMLNALRATRFSIFHIEGRHEEDGLVLTDALRGDRVWLMDEALTHHLAPPVALASRLCQADEFALTCGILVPLDEVMLDEILLECSAWLRHDDPARLASEPRLPATIYRAAVETHAMATVRFQAVAPAV